MPRWYRMLLMPKAGQRHTVEPSVQSSHTGECSGGAAADANAVLATCQRADVNLKMITND